MAWWDDLVNNVVGFGQSIGNALSSSGSTPKPGGRLPQGAGNYFNPDPTKNFNPRPPNPLGLAPGAQSNRGQGMAPGSLGVAPNSVPYSPLIDPNERASRELAGSSGFGSGNLGKLMTGQYVPGMSGNTQVSGGMMQDLSGLFGGGGMSGGSLPEISTFDKTLEDYLANAGSGEDLIANQLRSLDKQRQSGRSDARQGKQALGSIYGGLEKSFDKSKKSARQSNKAAQRDIQNSTDAAAASLTGALEAGNSDIAKTLAALGISDSAQQAQQTRDEYGTQNVNNTAQLGNADIANLVSRGESQQDFLAGSQAAAGFAGSDAQSEIQRDLLDYLQQIGGQESTLRDNAAMQARNQAVQQYNADAESFYQQQQAQIAAAEQAMQQDQQGWQRAMDTARLNWDQTQYYDQATRQQEQLAQEAMLAQQGANGLNNEGYMDAQNYLQNYFKTDQYATDAMAKAQQALAQVPAGGGYSDAASWLQEQYANRSPSVGQGALQALYLLTNGGKI